MKQHWLYPALQNHRKSAAAFCISILVTGCAAAGTLALAKSNGSEESANYREYQVERGDLTVGTSESGTVTLERVTVSFPVDATVDEILVRAGNEVTAGQTLIRLDPASISDGSAESITKLQEARVALQEAVTSQDSRLREAKLTCESSSYMAGYAPEEYSVTKKEIQHDVEAAQTTLQTTRESLSDYRALQESCPQDTERLEELESWVKDAEKQKKSYESQLSVFESDYSATLTRLNTLESERDKARTALDNANAALELVEDGSVTGGSASDAQETQEKAEYDYEVAKKAYTAYYNSTGKEVAEQKEALESQIAQYTAELENYTEACEDFKEDYDEKYKLTGKDLDAKVATLETEVKKAEIDLEKAQTTAKLSLQEADQKLQSSLNEAAGAQETYSLTAEKLRQEVASQQSAYDVLSSQLKDLESAIAGNGAVSAPCDGIVVSVNYAAGDDVQADQAIVVLAKPAEVSMSVSLSEEDITGVTLGQAAELSLTAYEDETFPATVDSISVEPARSGSASVSYTVTVKMTEENTSQVYEGMSGEVTLIQKQEKDVLCVSNQAITFENGISTVLVKGTDGEGVEKQVKTGFSNGRYVEILSGLEEGETVLAERAVTGT